MSLFLTGVLMAATLQVNVVNGTDPQKVVKGGYVHLFGFSPNGALGFQDSLRLRKGKVVFQVPDTTLMFTALYRYKDVPFTSAMDTVPNVTTLTITVYEPTDDLSKLTVERFHMILTNEKGDSVTVTEITSFSLDTNLVYTGGSAFFFPLPQGAAPSFQPLMPQDPGQWTILRDTVFYMGPLYPGPQVLAYGYRLPLRGGSVTLQRQFPSTMPVVDVFVSPLLSIKNTTLTSIGQRNLGGRPFQHYHGGNLMEFSMVIGLPSRLANTVRQWVIIGGVVVLAILVAIWLQQRQRGEEEEEDFEDEEGLGEALEDEEEDEEESNQEAGEDKTA